MAKEKNVCMAFALAFQKAGMEVYRQHTSGRRTPLTDVIEAMIEAAYQNLAAAITSKLVISGKILDPNDQTPKAKIQRRELVTVEILAMMGVDLQTLDTKHEYTVSILKRERRTKNV